jgi:hypothetical protein
LGTNDDAMQVKQFIEGKMLGERKIQERSLKSLYRIKLHSKSYSQRDTK